MQGSYGFFKQWIEEHPFSEGDYLREERQRN